MATAGVNAPRDIPAVSPTVDPAIRDPLARTREEVQRLLGFIGVDRLDMAVTWRQLAEQGFATLERLRLPGRGVPGSIVVPGSAVDQEPDLTPPPDATGLVVTAGFSFVTVQWDDAIYTQGHGHGQTNIYAVKRPIPDPSPAPVFADAAIVSNVFHPGTITSLPSEMNTRWHVWIKWQSADGVESINPTGGINGTTDDTGQDVTQLLGALTNAALNPGSPYTKVVFRADLFAIAPELDFYQEATPTGTVVGQLWGKPSTGVIKTWDGAAWQAFSAPLPFVVNTSQITEDGVPIPAGVYMDAANMRNLSAMTARLGTATIDGAVIANLNASIINAGILDADRIAAASITAAKLSVTDLAAISANMGAITAGTIDLNTSGFIRGGQTAYSTGTGFWLGYSGGAFKLSVGSAGSMLQWDGASLTIPAATVTGTLNTAQIADGAITNHFQDDQFTAVALGTIGADVTICEVNVTEPSGASWAGFAEATLVVSRPAYAVAQVGVSALLECYNSSSGLWTPARSAIHSFVPSSNIMSATLVLKAPWGPGSYTGMTKWRVVCTGPTGSVDCSVSGMLAASSFKK